MNQASVNGISFIKAIMQLLSVLNATSKLCGVVSLSVFESGNYWICKITINHLFKIIGSDGFNRDETV